jgi:Cys-tRNA(Pro)/Cys-tRNA(Cys) deacylase
VYEHHETATNFGEEAAAALGLREEQVFKTLVVSVDGALAVAIVPVANRLDLKAIAAAVGGKKATLADPALAEKRTGYVVGGISPVGQKTKLRTVVDESALSYPSIFVSGGRRGFDIEVAPADLVRVTEATAAAIARA